MTTRNEAAERLRIELGESYLADPGIADLDEALAAERRAAWERAEWILKGYRFGVEAVIWHDLRRAILDEEAAR